MTDFEKIQHLSFRAGFGLSFAEYESALVMPFDRYLKAMFAKATKQSNTPIKQDELFTNMTSKKRSSMTRKGRNQLYKKGQNRVEKARINWMKRMVRDQNSDLQERMCLFWHGHFACMTGKPHFMINQLNIYRKHGLGKFGDLLKAISKDVGMLFYLNNQQNKKGKPNENFAREILELFTLGTGNYSENDIKQAARAFTGWTGDFSGEFIFKQKEHDAGVKVFKNKKGKFGGEEIIDIILEDKQTANFITNKIYRYFVNEKGNKARVKELADQFYQSGYNIEKLMHTIFSSQWFYEKENIRSKIKSPIDLLAHLGKALNIKYTGSSLLYICNNLGQILFAPPNVAGWKRGKLWISNATIHRRLGLSELLYENNILAFENTMGNDEMSLEGEGKVELDFSAIEKFCEGKSKRAIIESLMNYCGISNSRISAEELYRLEYTYPKEEFPKRIFQKIAALPEYQMA